MRGAHRYPPSPKQAWWMPFTVSFLLCFGLALVWAAATPMFGVPDEVSHMIRAAAAVRGDVTGRPVGGEVLYRSLEVLDPGYTTPGMAPPTGNVCYAGNAARSASCLVLRGGGAEKDLASSAVSYPPVYYFLVGWPSLISQGAGGLYAMRAASAALFAALMALAMTSLPRGRTWATAHLGLAVAATPMVWFLGASATPSSTAIGAGFAAWCGGYRLLTDDDGVPLARLAWRFGLPLCLLLLVRRDSLVWAGVIVLVLTLLATRERLAAFARSRHVWFWCVGALGCAVFATASGGSYASSFVTDGTRSGSASAAFGHLLSYLVEMIGVLGWLDTSLPAAAYFLWHLAFGALLLGVLGLGRARVAFAVAVLVTIIVSLIVYFGAQVFPYFQGRYALPAAAGVPLLAGLGLAGKRVSGLPRRAVVVGLAVTFSVHALAFYGQLRRYARPGERSWDLTGDVEWQPEPAPALVLVGLQLLFMLGLSAWLLSRAHGRGEPAQSAP